VYKLYRTDSPITTQVLATNKSVRVLQYRKACRLYSDYQSQDW